MKLSTQWIRQFTDINLDDDELVRRIGSQLGAVESVENWGAYFSSAIVVAEIVEAAIHPDADKLGIYMVKISETETRSIVAGDKLLVVGDKVGYIPGAQVPLSVRGGEPFEIAEREIRGKLSQGMLGSAKELLISESHEGVLKLDTNSSVGTPFADAYSLNDLIIDIENKMFTHRPDLFGILGLARELAGIQGIQFSSPDWYTENPVIAAADLKEALPMSVTNETPELCPRFSAIALSNITIKPSPLMTQSMLTRVGLKTVNNVVDITNLTMYLTAQPSHVFDYDKVAERTNADGAALVVRQARSGEKIALLDGREIELSEDVVVVATDTEAISIAGSMGGQFTEVDETTINIILEVASWDLYSIRRTSFAHGIFTDAVTRYSKGQSPRQATTVLAKMLPMLHDEAGAKIASSLFDEYPAKISSQLITFDSQFVNVRLGSDFSNEIIATTLNNVEIQTDLLEDQIKVTVPYWRTDLECKEDLVEEVGRLHGYDNLPVDLPLRRASPNLRSNSLALKGHMREILSGMGAKEVLTYNFVSSKLFEKTGYDSPLLSTAYRIRNSISPELEYMRISLLPSILDKVTQNIRMGYDEFVLFELNKTHNKLDVDEDALPIERQSLALVYASTAQLNGSSYYKAKAYIVELCDRLGVGITLEAPEDRVETEDDETSPYLRSMDGLYATGRRAAIIINGVVVGSIGEFSSSIRRNFKLPINAAGFELDVDSLSIHAREFRPLSKFPHSSQDMTFDTPDDVTYAALENQLRALLTNEDYRLELTPLAIYKADDQSNRRITFRIIFIPLAKTLTTAEINTVIKHASDTLGAKGVLQI